MIKEQTIAHVIMESTGEPSKPTNVKVTNAEHSFYVRFEATLQRFNVKNRNNRIYTDGAMIPSLQAPHILELEKKKSWCGEAGHPLTDDVRRILTIDPKLISHKIVSHTTDRNFCRGVVETIDDGNGYGTRMTRCILQGMEVAFSLRALAPISKRGDGVAIIREKGHVVAYDWVFVPSHIEAYQDSASPVKTFMDDIEASGNTVTESYAATVTESAIKDFIAMESTNVKLISNVCEVAMGSMNVSKDFRNVILKESGATYIIPIEEKVKHDINSYMKSI